MGGVWRRPEGCFAEGTPCVQSSGLSHLSLGGFRGRGRIETAKVSSLRTFQKLKPPAKVVEKTKLGSFATSCQGQIRSQECVCVCIYMDVEVCRETPLPHRTLDIRLQDRCTCDSACMQVSGCLWETSRTSETYDACASPGHLPLSSGGLGRPE